MKKSTVKILTVVLAALTVFSAVSPCVFSADGDVDEVIAQLQAIDTLAQMQSKKSQFTVSGNYNADDPDSVREHLDAVNGYRNYVIEMLAQRAAAKQAYELLSDSGKEQIPAELTEKLSDTLDTVFRYNSYPVTQRFDEYCYEVIFPRNLVYELSSHFSPGIDMPATIILTNTAELGGSSWTPDGPYSYGTNNYDLTYCCDLEVMPVNGTHYKIGNLEDSGHYGVTSARHIRAIVENSYPFVTIDEMKENLKAGGLDSGFVDSLTRSDIIAGVQMAIWAYSNMSNERIEQSVFYGGSLDITKQGVMTLVHNYGNEIWDWAPVVRNRKTYNDESAYKVNNLVYYLYNLEGVEPTEEQIVVSDVEMVRAKLRSGSADTFDIGMYVNINGKLESDDDITITVKSGHDNGSGNFIETDRISIHADTKTKYPFTVTAKAGDTVSVETSGIQNLAKGVYLFEPEGGKDVSQSLVGVTEGPARIRATDSFVFNGDIEKGIRIFKTSAETGNPVKGIEFEIYRADGAQGDTPTQADIDLYATDSSKVGSAVTDSTGYACLELEDGRYLVVEAANPDLIEAPVEPFFISIPSPVPASAGEYTSIASVYPKNTLKNIPDEPKDLIIPDNVSGTFSIVKYKAGNEEEHLEGAEFKVYRPAHYDDTEYVTLQDGSGESYAAVPVTVEGEELVLRSDENGNATSPDLPCGTYYLEEIKAPSGYHKSSDIFIVNVVSELLDAPSESLHIANIKSSALPETGGIGTYLFVGVGAVVMIAALVFALRKKENNPGEADKTGSENNKTEQ
ncbi:MAG: Cys-Gln thioester bond-forming surface protein [Clostridia bacterium]|nr:Cys-Gln thioester bond-forming surface protein [Clostridia bacterium]